MIELEYMFGIAGCLDSMADLATLEQLMRRSARIRGAAEALRRSMNLHLPPDYLATYSKEIARTREVIGDDAFDAAWDEGIAMTWKHAVEYALAPE